MADRLTTTPKTWFLECLYCNPKDGSITHPFQQRRHETELLDKAGKLCRNYSTNHFLDYVTAELDTLDHSILTPASMIEILTQIHTKLGCTCLTNQTHEIEELARNTHNVTIPKAFALPSKPQMHPQRSGKTLLERLQNGKNVQQKH